MLTEFEEEYLTVVASFLIGVFCGILTCWVHL